MIRLPLFALLLPLFNEMLENAWNNFFFPLLLKTNSRMSRKGSKLLKMSRVLGLHAVFLILLPLWLSTNWKSSRRIRYAVSQHFCYLRKQITTISLCPENLIVPKSCHYCSFTVLSRLKKLRRYIYEYRECVTSSIISTSLLLYSPSTKKYIIFYFLCCTVSYKKWILSLWRMNVCL